MKYTVTAQLIDGAWIAKENTNYSFSGEDGVLYLYDDDGSFAYVNFDHCLQVGAMPEGNE